VATPVERWRSRRDERRTDERQRSQGDQYGESEHVFSRGENSPGDVPEIGVPADAVAGPAPPIKAWRAAGDLEISFVTRLTRVSFLQILAA
jgi:hypothetical protein